MVYVLLKIALSSRYENGTKQRNIQLTLRMGIYYIYIYIYIYVTINIYIKEQYPVTAHVPNLDFRTECREFKRCEESQRTLKNPFASRFAEFDTTQNFSELQINDMVFLLSFNLGKIGINWLSFHCLWPEDQEKGSVLIPVEGLFLPPASIQAQIIVKGIRRNGTATIKTM